MKRKQDLQVYLGAVGRAARGMRMSKLKPCTTGSLRVLSPRADASLPCTSKQSKPQWTARGCDQAYLHDGYHRERELSLKPLDGHAAVHEYDVSRSGLRMCPRPLSEEVAACACVATAAYSVV